MLSEISRVGYMWNLKNKTKFIERTDWCSPGGQGGKTGERAQKVQTSSYKINESWGCNIQYDDYS